MTSKRRSVELDAQAREILERNDRGGYTVPTSGLYPFQWNWDSAFVALGFATFDRRRAWQELDTLCLGQWDDGMIPHIVFHQDDEGYFPGPDAWATKKYPPTSGISQPPVLASVVRTLWEAQGRNPSDPQMCRLYPKLLGYHRWFHRFRDPLNRGLVVATHPWETGRDNSPEWDEALASVDTSQIGDYTRRDTSHVDTAMRPTDDDYDRYVALVDYGRAQRWDPRVIAEGGPFRVIDVGMTMVLLRADRDLLVMAEAIGDAQAVGDLRARIERSEAGVEWLWNDEVGAYCSRDVVTLRSSGLLTSASFLAFYAGVGSPKQKNLTATLDRAAARCEYLMPSLEPGSAQYDPMRYWRGPVWLVVNHLVAKGLAESGYKAWSQRIRADSARLVERSGFYESFSPETGAGTGGQDFSWTAAMWLAWCGDRVRTD